MAYVGMPVFGEPISAVTASPTVDLGERRFDTAGNEYIYGYNASNSLMEPGVPVFFGSNNVGYSFTISNATQSVPIMAVVHHQTCPTGSYAWFGVRGLFRACPDSNETSMNAGDEIVAGSNGGWKVRTPQFVDGSGSTIVVSPVAINYGLAAESLVTGYGQAASFTSLGLSVLGRAWIRTALS